jgi:hypothetical protein
MIASRIYITGSKGVNFLKLSGSSYCGECLEDFKDGETVWYAWIENRSFCGKCKQKLDIKDWEPRIYKEGK